MKKLSLLSLFAVSFMLSFSAYGQMPVGNVMSSTNCSLADGVGMRELVQWFRDNPRNSDSTNLVFVRQPIIMGANFTDNYDFRLVTYYGSYGEYVSQRQARRSRFGEARVRPSPLPQNMFSCDFANQNISLVRQVPDGDAFTGDYTLMSQRLCFLNEGVTQADAYNFVVGVAAGFRRGGDNSLMQVSTRAFGPIQNVTAGGAVLVTSVPATADAMAARLDLTREGLDVVQGLDNVMACAHPSLWQTNAVYRPN
tara:strand:+ start:117 stop:875 length:759 start_codon:yes stop_codon:yes gene_type:complete